MMRILIAVLVAGTALAQQPAQEDASAPDGPKAAAVEEATDVAAPAPEAQEKPEAESGAKSAGDAEKVKRPTEQETRATKRVAAFWFILPGKQAQ